MPYKSDAQRRLMQAVAHDAAFAHKVGIPQSVGQKFEAHKAKGGRVSKIAWKEEPRPPVDINDVFAEGGEVDNALPTLSQAASVLGSSLNPFRIGNPNDTQQFAEGVLSQIYGLNEKGEPQFLGGGGGGEWKGWPGIVDETLSLPTILPERWVPEVSKRAAERLEQLKTKIHRDMNLKPAEGLRQNLYNAAGTMAAQIPTGGPKAVEGALAKPGLWRNFGRTLKALPEWFTPTVEASPINYATGAVTGGALNSLSGPEGSPGVNEKYCGGGPVNLAKGGKARGVKSLFDWLKEFDVDFRGTEPSERSGNKWDSLFMPGGKGAWNPRITPSDFDTLVLHGTEGTYQHPEILGKLDELIDKYGLAMPRSAVAYRGLSLKDLPSKGDVMKGTGPQSFSLDRNLANEYIGATPLPDYKPTLVTARVPEGVKVLPQPFSGQVEFVMPSLTDMRVLSVKDPTSFPKLKTQVLPKYASGGKAPDPSSALDAIQKAVAAIQAGDHEGATAVLVPHSSNPEISKALESLRSAVADQKDQ